MAETDIQSHLTKIKLELKRLLQSAVAILEKVQGQNPTSWDQLDQMMMKTAAESSGLDEMIQNYVMILESSPAALGINTNFQYKVSIESENLKTVDGETLLDTNQKWIDVTTGQEFVATPIMQALAESIQSEITQRFWFGPTKVLMSTTKCDRLVCQSCLEEVKEGYWDWLSSLVSHLLDAADHKTTW